MDKRRMFHTERVGWGYDWEECTSKEWGKVPGEGSREIFMIGGKTVFARLIAINGKAI